MALKLKDKLDVSTPHGSLQIELCVGDVTQLERSFDVLVISAIKDDYSPTPTSVIGALHNKLNLSVENLSKNKEEDLLSLFSCWWSETPNFLMKRVLCYEGIFKNPPRAIAEVFRSLIAFCKNQNTTVVMPLLASGDQSFNKNDMLQLIFDGSTHWMQAGLPLRLLRIVLYAPNVNKLDDATTKLCDHFALLKKKLLIPNPLTLSQEKLDDFHIYMSYSDNDQQLANEIVKMFGTLNNKIRIVKPQKINEKELWQEEIYKVMKSCARVVALLSPHYLQDSSCIEQYNIALCCSRSKNNNGYLVPLYVSQISSLPNYMGLIQYVDCRPSNIALIKSACKNVSDSMFPTVSNETGSVGEPVENDEISEDAT